MGWVLDARSNHQPSALSALTPSMAVNRRAGGGEPRADLVGDLELTLIGGRGSESPACSPGAAGRP